MPEEFGQLIDACLDLLVDLPDSPNTQAALAAVRDLLSVLGYLPPT